MVAHSEERIAELGKLLKGKIRTDWALLDEAYRKSFHELMGLLRHREIGRSLHDASSGQAQSGSGAHRRRC